MNEYIPNIADEFIVPLNINGMKGRMLHLPAPNSLSSEKKREMLLVYGHHASLERMYSFSRVMNRYGSVTMPDLPGFGGMDSFYKIGKKPTLDNMADYLAAIIKLRFKNRKVTIGGFSFGFLVVTRMLQRYPDIAKQVDLVVSCVGFAHHEDFSFSKTRTLFYRWTGSLVSHYLPSLVFRYVALSPLLIRPLYSRMHNAKHKFGDLNDEEKKAMTEFEIELWHINDARTYGATTVILLTVDNCKQQLDLPVWHVSVRADNYFDQASVEQHMRVIFSEFHHCRANLHKHSMNVIAKEADSAVFVPRPLSRELNKKT